MGSAESMCRINELEFGSVIAHGTISVTRVAVHRPTGTSFAVKQTKKALAVVKQQVHLVLNELNVLKQLKHPFIARLRYACQDQEDLYLLLDCLEGGQLHTRLHSPLTEEQTKFAVACILTALEYVHFHNFVLGDLRPHNAVFDRKGYLRLTGFRRASLQNEVRPMPKHACYSAPEILSQVASDTAADYYSLGVIAFQCMYGRLPTPHSSITKTQAPPGWSLDSIDFVNKLLSWHPAERLGAHGASEVKRHSWLADFPWKALFEKQLPSPFQALAMRCTSWPKDYVSAVECPEALQEMFAGYVS